MKKKKLLPLLLLFAGLLAGCIVGRFWGGFAVGFLLCLACFIGTGYWVEAMARKKFDSDIKSMHDRLKNHQYAKGTED